MVRNTRYNYQSIKRIAQRLQLNDTYYANPHGLANKQNKSSAYNQAQLAFLITQEQSLRDIVSCKTYTCKILGEDGNVRKQKWTNTNKLLEVANYFGVKTGVTQPAGPCLSSHYVEGNHNFGIVILNSKSMEDRWEDTKQIVQYGLQKQGKRL